MTNVDTRRAEEQPRAGVEWHPAGVSGHALLSRRWQNVAMSEFHVIAEDRELTYIRRVADEMISHPLSLTRLRVGGVPDHQAARFSLDSGRRVAADRREQMPDR
jgi:hypothetical protein